MRFANVVPPDTKIASVLLIFFTIVLLYVVPAQIEEEVGHHYQSPRIYPQLLIGVMIILSIIFTISSVRKRKLSVKESGSKSSTPMENPTVRVCIVILSCALYIWIFIEWVGFILASMILLAFLIRLYGYGNRLITLLVAAITPVVVYYIFKASLQMPLPLGRIFGYD